MELHYNNVLPMVNNTGDEQYNGNIAAIKWNTPEFGLKAYGYGYDNINRLERAKFAAGAALNIDVDKYTVENITYDANGNILTLGRHNTTAGYIDNLTMTYDGNQLKKTHDSGDLVLGFVDMVDYETEYQYDHNGSMYIDDNKGITLAYNHLNLPKEIVGGNDTVRYIYDAAGTKISKELAQSGAVSYTDYVGNFVYKDGDLDYILTGEGRITEPVSGTIQYEYFLKDHLGNTRAVFADGNDDGSLADNEVLQENHYYPFGYGISDLAVDRGVDNKLKYNGKELQDDALDGVQLNYYAYGWRDYDPIVPHFNRIDRFSEKYCSFSPYQYAANNPILYIDVNGDSLSTNAWKWANKMVAHINSQQQLNTQKISNLDTKLENGNISQRAYDRKSGRLNEANTELESTRGEIATLAASDQIYNVAETTGLTNASGEDAAGITSFNFSTNQVDMHFNSKSYGLGEMAHEFKHAYQFETGQIDLSGNGSSAALWDIYDERAANYRSGFFGSQTTTDETGSRGLLQTNKYTTQQQMNNQFKRVHPATKRAYRINNKTFIWKP